VSAPETAPAEGVAAQEEPFPLRLRVQLGNGVTRDLTVTAAPTATVAELADALAAELGTPISTRPAYVHASGRLLRRETTIGSAGLVHGDRLSFEEEAEPDLEPGAPGHELVVVGGCLAGRRFPLASGLVALGRDRQSDLALEADATLSARHLSIQNAGDTIDVTDLGSRNGTAVNGIALAANETRRLDDGDVVSAGRTQFVVRRFSPTRPNSSENARRGTIEFNRPPRVNKPWQPPTFELDAAPDDPQRARLPIVASLLPLVFAFVLWQVTGSRNMIFFALLTPLLAVSSFLEDRKGGKRNFRNRAQQYRERLHAIKGELDVAQEDERLRRNGSAPYLSDLLERVSRHQRDLWDRRPADPDFLRFRLGAAAQPSEIKVVVAERGSEKLRAEAAELRDWYATLPLAPALAPLSELGVLGIVGSNERIEGVARNLVTQVAALHSPANITLAAALPTEIAENWDWLKWLPHTQSASSPLDQKIGVGRLPAREVIEAVSALLDERRTQVVSQLNPVAFRDRAVILLVDERSARDRATIVPLLVEGPALGIYTIWLGSEPQLLPGECGGVFEVFGDVVKASFTNTASGETIDDLTADELALELATQFALDLAPLRDVSAGGAAGRVPERVALRELLNVEDFGAVIVADMWQRSGELAAPIGATAEGMFKVDLRADGPHGLIAGTTGAGKSELLQTLVASLALHIPPQRLNFILVDYKGGAAFSECVELPHTVGFVTDLDEHLTQRALVSLEAELRTRERILGAANAKDLMKMEQIAAAEAPPSLLIVIDEFATLAKEVPEFVQGVVGVAQRGRSLGVHLLLATQRPGGVVSENIRANTNLRIALRVNDAAESSDVIGVNDAARISRTRPGRAFARIGHSDLVEFQTAYVGGTRHVLQSNAPIVLEPFELVATRSQAAALSVVAETDLRQMVRAARDAAREMDTPPLRLPWLPELPAVLPLEELDTDGRPSSVAVVGLRDQPNEQVQRPHEIDLDAEGSLLVYGASASGKTTLLRTLALSLARRNKSADLHIYGLDFATRGLKLLEPLPHCGDVVLDDDEERVTRLFMMLRHAVEARKELLGQHRAADFREYNALGVGSLPRILVLLDGYAGFRSTFEDVNLGELIELLPRLISDGRALGVHFMISADRRGAIPNAISSVIPSRIALRMANADEYVALGLDMNKVRGARLPAGRGFVGDGIEFQTAILGRETSGERQAAAIQAFAATVASEERAPAVEPLPTSVARTDLLEQVQPLRPILGLRDSDLRPLAVDLTERHFLVAGPYRSGRTTALGTLAFALRASDPELELHLLAPRRSALNELAIWTSSARGSEGSDELAAQLATVVEARSIDDPDLAPIFIIIDDGEELAETSGGRALELIVRKGRDVNIRVVASAERQAAQRSFSGWLREIRKEQHGLALNPDADIDGDLFGVRLPRRTNMIFPPGRGYLVSRNGIELVQVAH
jgi:S-DNA-T family DNA segregation ATPase FtsK/SpoIIIE